MNRIHRKVGPAVLALSLVLALGACSSSSDSTDSADTTAAAGAPEDTGDTTDGDSDEVNPVAEDDFDACALLTVEDVESVLGGEFQIEDSPDPDYCVYVDMTFDPNTSTSQQVQVSFTPIAHLGGQPFDEYVGVVAEQLDETDITPVDSLGKPALLTSGGETASLFIESEAGILGIGVIGVDDDATAAEELTEIAIGNL